MTSLMFWNLFETSRELRNGDDQHWREQVAVVNRLQPDILAVTEAWDWQHDDQALFHRAREEFGYTDGVFYEAKTNCNMAVFWRSGTELVSSSGQPQQVAFWHGYLRATLSLPGASEPLTLVVAHLNPFDPTLRRIEGSWLRVALQGKTRGLLVMDANTVPPGDPEPPSSPNQNQVGDPHCDRTPLAGLAEAKLIDVGAALDDRQPTFGYYGREQSGDFGPRPLRLDQAWATPALNLTEYRVIDGTQGCPETDSASDHRPIMIDFD